MCNCCHKKIQKLSVKEVDIDFNQSTGSPKATITLGKCFRKHNVYVVSQPMIGNQSGIEKCHHLCTDQCGKFTIPIPQSTSHLELKIKIKLKQGCCVNTHCPHFIKVNKKFAPYTEYDLVWKTYNGSENNLFNPAWGMVNIPLIRKATPPAYSDGPTGSELATRGPNNPNPRLVSNKICKSTGSKLNSLSLTDLVWGFGQFLDHEIDLTKTSSTGETADMITPSLAEDPTEAYPEYTIKFTRSEIVPNTAPREQPNHISCFIDASNVYGYSTERAYALRKLDGSGKLKTGLADNGEVILPYNTYGLDNAGNGQSPEELFLGGDIRANENILLMGFHVLFVREHNRLCEQILTDRPEWTGQDELIYQHARRIVSGLMQNIVFEEYLPSLLGNNAISQYQGYDNTVDPRMATEFSTVGYRLGHSMLSSNLKIGATGTRLLRDSFFNPVFTQEHGIESVLHGAAKQIMQEIDGEVVDDIRDFLFGAPSAQMLLDLAALNIQRGRDHGIPGYNTVREGYGLPSVSTFAEITGNTGIQAALEELYDHPDYIDPWIGCLVEDHVSGAAVGPLLIKILKDQFERLRDGDRFFFENDQALSTGEKQTIRETTLSDIILRNTNLDSSQVQNDAFHL